LSYKNVFNKIIFQISNGALIKSGAENMLNKEQNNMKVETQKKKKKTYKERKERFLYFLTNQNFARLLAK